MKLKQLLSAISEVQQALSLLNAQGLHNRNLDQVLNLTDSIVKTSSKTETKNKSPKKKS